MYLEFEVHRPLYEWFLNHIAEPGQIRPKQREFARLNLTYTVMSKRKLLQLVEEKHVSGWDDPRMPTISGLRRRGFTPESVRNFAEKVGVSKRENIIDVALLEHCIREDLNKTAPRVMAVLQPLKVVITNPEGKPKYYKEKLIPKMNNRAIEIFRLVANCILSNLILWKMLLKFFRLSPGNECV